VLRETTAERRGVIVCWEGALDAQLVERDIARCAKRGDGGKESQLVNAARSGAHG
jgi:hypothetical protein